MPGIVIVLLLLSSLNVGAQDKKPLDHSAYDIWNRITGKGISRDGQWVHFSAGPEEKDLELQIKSLVDDRAYQLPRGESARFTADSRHLVTLVKSYKDTVKQAKRDKLKPDKMPKDSLKIVTLETGTVFGAARVKSYKVPEESGVWLAYLLEKKIEAKKDSTEAAKTKAKEVPEESKKEEGKPEEEEKGKTAKDKKKKKDREKAEGTTLVLRHLGTGVETEYADAVSYHFSEDGSWLVYVSASKDSTADGIRGIRTAAGDSVVLLEGSGDYKGVTIDESGRHVAFVTNRDSFTAKQPEYVLYHWRTGARSPRELAREGTPGLPEGWWVSEHGKLEFSKDGKRLFFGTAPRPEPEPESETPEDEKVVVDIWNWQDPHIQPRQLKALDKEKKRSYRAVAHLKSGRIVQLATTDLPDIRLGSEGNADIALGITTMPYRKETSWDIPGYQDVYVIDVKTGKSRQILRRVQDRAALSPQSRYIYWWNREEGRWFGRKVGSSAIVELSKGIPFPLYNEDDDHAFKPGSYGGAGWVKGDKGFLVNDRFDIWLTDPEGKRPPRNITEGTGRADSLRLRYVRLDPDERSRDPEAPLLLSAHSFRTKAAGFYRDTIRAGTKPVKLLMEDRSFSRPTKARDADRVLLTRSAYSEFPDLWVSDQQFRSMRKVSDVNPQQSEYLWGTSDLVEWTSLDGHRLQGILCKPENFDPANRYPTLVFFYERFSHLLHNYWTPRAPRSSISPSFYTSRGYLVFIPDIPYKVGFPGDSAVNAVVSGITHLIDEGYADPARIGTQSHSWGGYQIAYMLTRTGIFAAAEAGAPVSNMISAYGGIRWSSGRSRMFQYEKHQSRIGGSLWEAPTRFIENSPIFWADKIETPLLILHNDRDGAVPWYQGIELFVALRRLGKPAWMLNYNGEGHGLKKPQNKRDWGIRMQQFFDHYLKDAPPPKWLTEGVPAIEKGKTLGLELVQPTD
jgi:dipeptidyl aminopeptidase/acylaminoacyl peptidase